MDTVPQLKRRRIRLSRAGDSRMVVLPNDWLAAHGIEDAADLVLTSDGIMVIGPHQESHSIEDRPEFARFLAFLTRDALNHPERLGDIGALMAQDEESYASVELI